MPSEYAVQYLRPDGWWEAGRGWSNEDSAKRDAADQLPHNVRWRVVLVGNEEDKEAISNDD